MDDLAFGLLLSPHSFADKAADITDEQAKNLLKTFLGLLQAEKAWRSTPATQATTPTTSEEPGAADVIPLPSPGDPAPPSSFPGAAPAIVASTQQMVPPPTRKQAVLQLLCLQLTARLEWSLAELATELTLSLQQQLFDCLTAATRTQKTLSELTLDNVEETIAALSTCGSYANFAVALFFQWVVRCSTPALPLPTGNKAAILASAAASGAYSFSLPSMPWGGSEALQQWVASLSPLALRVLRAMLNNQVSSPRPSLRCVVIKPENFVQLEAPQGSVGGWSSMASVCSL